MIKYLFKTIPNILTIPFFVTSILGLLLFIFVHSQKRRKRLLILSIPFIIIGWRLFSISIMASKRYSEILIYPAIILSAYFCNEISKLFFYKSNGSFGKIVLFLKKRISLICFSILFLLSLGKTFRFDKYSKHVPQICSYYNSIQINGTEPIIFTNGHEEERIQYYCDLSPIQCLTIQNIPELSEQQTFIQHVKKHRNFPGLFYYFRATRTPSDKDILSELSIDSKNWLKCASFFTSKQKTKKLILYRFIPPCENIQEWLSPIPEYSDLPDNTVRYYGFEQADQALEIDLMEHSVGHETSHKTTLYLPREWRIDFNRQDKNPLPIVTLSDINPLSGKKSLLLDTTGTTQHAGAYYNPLNNYNYHISFFVRGNSIPYTFLSVQVRTIPEKSKTFKRIQTLYFKIDVNKIYRISLNLNKKEYPVDTKYISVLLYVWNGSASVDQYIVQSF